MSNERKESDATLLGNDLLGKLYRDGVIGPNVRRVIIDIPIGGIVTVYTEEVGAQKFFDFDWALLNNTKVQRQEIKASKPVGIIYVYRPDNHDENCAAVAYAQDGETIACQVSSSYSEFRRAMHLENIPREQGGPYWEKYPGGFQLIEVIGQKLMREHIDARRITGLYFSTDASHYPGPTKTEEPKP